MVPPFGNLRCSVVLALEHQSSAKMEAWYFSLATLSQMDTLPFSLLILMAKFSTTTSPNHGLSLLLVSSTTLLRDIT
jgi:hypothetical protein